jgi:uncharacterized protein with ParB-like and HNH nuclease domain
MESNAKTPSLFDVVKNYTEISVADYQRTYSWGADQIEELFDDLKDLDNDSPAHFFGSIILQTDGQNGKAEVVDGQQRLTTAFLLMATLRDEVTKLDVDTIKRSSERRRDVRVIDKAEEFIYAYDDTTDSRFISNRHLRDILEKEVIPEPGKKKTVDEKTQISLALRKAIKQIHNLVSDDLETFPSDEEKLQRIYKHIMNLRDRFIVLSIETSNVTESLDIFLTLNDRGLPLGPSDLVRGRIMSQLAHDENKQSQLRIFNTIFDEWKTIADTVKEPETFLRHFLLSTSRKPIKKKKIHDAVYKRINASDNDTRKLLAQDFWTALTEASEVYGTIVNPDQGGETEYFIRLLEGLQKSHRILVLATLETVKDKDDRAELIRHIMILSYRWMITGGNAQMLENFFQAQANDLREDSEPSQIIAALMQKTPEVEDSTIKKYFIADGDTSFISRALLHYIDRITSTGSNGVTLDGTIHLEHVSPKTETPEWRIALFGKDSEVSADYESKVSEIGNLTLLDERLNIKAKQKSFNEKQVFYNRSLMIIARDLVGLSIWDESIIDQRTDWLCESFKLLFSLEEKSSQIQPFTEWLAAQPKE